MAGGLRAARCDAGKRGAGAVAALRGCRPRHLPEQGAGSRGDGCRWVRYKGARGVKPSSEALTRQTQFLAPELLCQPPACLWRGSSKPREPSPARGINQPRCCLEGSGCTGHRSCWAFALRLRSLLWGAPFSCSLPLPFPAQGTLNVFKQFFYHPLLPRPLSSPPESSVFLFMKTFLLTAEIQI